MYKFSVFKTDETWLPDHENSGYIC